MKTRNIEDQVYKPRERENFMKQNCELQPFNDTNDFLSDK